MKHQGLSVEEAFKKAAHYCAYQERCHKEVRSKLQSLGMYASATDYIIGKLIENDFLNEERFAKSFARGKHLYKGWGKKRIEQELKLREISVYNIRSAFKEIEKDYLKNFYALADKQWASIHEPNPDRKKKKWIDFLLRKGYESPLIFDTLRNYE